MWTILNLVDFGRPFGLNLAIRVGSDYPGIAWVTLDQRHDAVGAARLVLMTSFFLLQYWMLMTISDALQWLQVSHMTGYEKI